MKQIYLSNGKSALVDGKDFENISKFKWSFLKSGYACRFNVEKRRQVLMHREIMGIDDTKIWVDHKNHNGLDNRRSNLRICDSSQNQANSKIYSSNKSGYKGVFKKKIKRNGKVYEFWVAQIQVMGKRIHLGTSQKPEVAARIYNNAALYYFGKFANINNNVL
jgi:hypothetical protein